MENNLALLLSVKHAREMMLSPSEMESAYAITSSVHQATYVRMAIVSNL
jgi:hypothetical protein